MPDTFTSASQTITASTTNIAGYTIDISTADSTNALVHSTDPTLTIPTFTMPQGSSSVPAANTGYGYGYSIDNGANYSAIPAPGTHATIFTTSTAGTNQHTLTFGVRTTESTAAGEYSNTLILRAVANLEPCAPGKICYYGNDDDGTGTMPDQSASSNSTAVLIPSNFSRPGYGFVGWNTAIDGTGTTYGPNATITTGDLSTVGLQLYAKWTPSVGILQEWTGCNDLSEGTVIALTDERDDSTYAVTKYADGQCWMMENLRLDLSDQDLEISSNNTNHPTSSFAHSFDNTNQNANNTHPASTNSFCSSNTTACIDQILFNTNNTNRNLTASYDTNDTTSSWYSYGNYYNWYTATAGNGTRALETGGSAANGDLCPASWRLPAGYGDVGDLSRLDIAYGGSGRNQPSESGQGTAGSERWRAFPLNYLYSGEQRGNTGYNRGSSNSYATLSAASVERTSNLWLTANSAAMNSNNTPKYRGQTIRCLYNEGYHFRGNIHYDANGGTGTMSDQIDVDFGVALALPNQFTRANHTFSSWNTSADGSGVVVSEYGMVAGAADRMGITDGETLTLYAIWKPLYSLTYNGNGADAGSMTSVDVPELTIGTLQLSASNYSRAGYGFAGWSLDPDAATKLINHQSVTVYGPNETININSAFLANADITDWHIPLYAVWLPEDSTYTMQTFTATECSAMNVGDTLALKDTRDNNTYAVTKLQDNHCWMMENLRLDLTGITLDSTNTNSPTTAFVADSPTSSTTATMCNQENSACIDQILYNTDNINRTLPVSHNSNQVGRSWYSYGVTYNWYTASAGNGDYAMDSGNVAGDLCPAGWRLPTGGAISEYVTLNNLVNNGSSATDLGLRTFPANFVYSGDFNYNKPGGRNTYGRWWSATPNGTDNAFRLGTSSSGATPAGSWAKWDAFAIRCIVK